MGRQCHIQQMLCSGFELIKVWETQQRLSEFNKVNAIITYFMFVCSLKLLSLSLSEWDWMTPNTQNYHKLTSLVVSFTLMRV